MPHEPGPSVAEWTPGLDASERSGPGDASSRRRSGSSPQERGHPLRSSAPEGDSRRAAWSSYFRPLIGRQTRILFSFVSSEGRVLPTGLKYQTTGRSQWIAPAQHPAAQFSVTELHRGIELRHDQRTVSK